MQKKIKINEREVKGREGKRKIKICIANNPLPTLPSPLPFTSLRRKPRKSKHLIKT